MAVTLAALGFAFLAASCGTTTHAAGATVVLGENDAGHTVKANVGDTVRVTLVENRPVPGSSLTWNVTSSDPSVLQPGAVTRNPATITPVGSDTYTADFLALKNGQAVLDAHGTTSCEAMVKTACPDRDFKITVVVSG
jgi:predicted secreted protein